MSSIKFGVRSVRVKAYDLSKFHISKEEAESFAVKYELLDLWNFDKEHKVEAPQVEKRVMYFHIIFIPIFPVAVHWTIRNKEGIFKVNTICKQKIKSVYPKSYGPWYSFLAPILLLAGLIMYGVFDFTESKLKEHKASIRVKAERRSLLKALDTTKTPFYLVLSAPFKSDKRFLRVDSIVRNNYYISSLAQDLNIFNYQSVDYNYHDAFKNYSTFSNVIAGDSIIALIPENREDDSFRNSNYKLRRIVSVDSMEIPNIEFDFRLRGIIIKNHGKPVSLVDFKDKSVIPGRWEVETDKYLAIETTTRATYLPTDKEVESCLLEFTFTDNKNLYTYEVKGVYKKANTYTAFTETSVMRL